MKWIISLLFFIPFVIFSQDTPRFSINFDSEPLYDALLNIEDIYNMRFSFPDAVVLKKKITLKKADRTLQELLEQITQETNLQFEVVNSRYIIISNVATTINKLQQLDNVIINGYLVKGISKNKDATFQIKPKVLGVLPGLTESDVLESIQQLPSVISPNETASGFLVRGGSADQNRIIWNGINIYHKGHLFGMISPINPNVAQNIKFYNKGTNARFGERISSVIDIQSNSKINKSSKFEFGTNAISADAYAEVPILKNKLSVQGSFRRSYDELIRFNTLTTLTDKVFQNSKITNARNATNYFSFMDYTIRINYKPDSKNSLSLSTININNRLDYLVKDDIKSQSFNDVLTIENKGYSFSWKKNWSSRIEQHTQAFLSNYKLNYNFITKEDTIQISNFKKQNAIYDSGLSTELQILLPNKNSLALGYQYVLKDVSYIFSNTTNLALILDSDKTVITTNSIYGNYRFRNLKFADINLGLRATYFGGLDALRLEPRFQLYKKLFKNVKLHLTAEIKNQIISEIDETVLSDLSIENKLWRLADGNTFPIINSYQVSAGFFYARNGWRIDIDNYYKNIDGKTALSLGFLNLDNPNFNIGEQRIFGSEIFVKKSFRPFTAWLSYTFNTIENKFEGINNNRLFTANTNIRHAFNTSITYQKKQLQLALGWRWHSGKPFTKSFIDSEGNISFDKINTEVLPSFHRLDFSATYDFVWSKNKNINSKLGVSIRNIYNRSNFLSRDYISDNDLGNKINIIDRFSLGFMPNVLFRIYW